mgnify:CR=1 FL=1
MYFDAYTPDQKKSNRLRQLISAAESVGGVVSELNHRTKEELARQLSASAKRQGSVLSYSNAGYLIDTCSSDSPYDDVLIFADPYDVTDHKQDGYYTLCRLIVPLDES